VLLKIQEPPDCSSGSGACERIIRRADCPQFPIFQGICKRNYSGLVRSGGTPAIPAFSLSANRLVSEGHEMGDLLHRIPVAGGVVGTFDLESCPLSPNPVVPFTSLCEGWAGVLNQYRVHLMSRGGLL
jgi:hypothetical protein